MELIKNKMSIVNYFLPRNAQLVTLENYCDEPAILEGDLDQDGHVEMMALYKKDEKYYLMGLKREKRKWYVVWNRVMKYKSVIQFQLVHLQMSKSCEVAIAGKMEGMEKNHLMLLVWKEEEAQPLLAEYIVFDKLYIQDVDGLDGKDEIVLWQHKALEAYDVHIYRYEEGNLVEDTSLEAFYYPSLVGYYEYLNETYPDQLIYKTYLEAVRSKCQRSTSNLIEPQQASQQESQHRAHPIKRDFLIGMCAYLEEVEVEEDVFLMGKQEQGEDYFVELQLMVTYAHQTKKQFLRLEADKVYDYEMKVGRFFDNDQEQVFIKVNSKTEDATKKCWVIGLEQGYLFDYVQANLSTLCDEEKIETLGECYPIEISMTEPLMLGVKYRMWDEKGKEEGFRFKLFKGEEKRFKWYKTFIIKEEKGG